jgi:hypothetical protein
VYIYDGMYVLNETTKVPFINANYTVVMPSAETKGEFRKVGTRLYYPCDTIVDGGLLLSKTAGKYVTWQHVDTANTTMTQHLKMRMMTSLEKEKTGFMTFKTTNV